MTLSARGWLNIVLIAVGAAAVILVLMLVRQCNAPKPDIIAAVDSTQYYKNKLGQEVAAVKQREEDFYRVREAGYLDSIAKLYNTKAKLLQEVATLTQKGTVTITVPGKPVITTDTIQVTGDCIIPTSVAQVFSNPYYSAEVTIPLSSNDSSRMTLQTFDTLTIVTKTVKEGGLFNKQTYLQIDAVNANPYNHVSGLQVYRKPLPKPKKIGIGIFAGYGIGGTGFKPGVMIGAGVQYNFIRL